MQITQYLKNTSENSLEHIRIFTIMSFKFHDFPTNVTVNDKNGRLSLF